MRGKRNNKRNSENESAASSFQSTDSFGIFGGVCSDLSDGEDEKHTHEHTDRSPDSHKSFRIHEREKTPLLQSQAMPIVYKAINNNSDTPIPDHIFGSDILTTLKRTSEKSKTDPSKQSSLVTIFSVWNTIMGSSLLSIAWGIERAGLPVALLLLVSMAALCLYTAYLLIQVNARHGGIGSEVPALCGLLLGRSAAAVAQACSLLVLAGACACYWLLLANSLYYTVTGLVDITTSNTTYNSTVLCPSEARAVPILEAPAPAEAAYWGLHSTVPLYVAVIIYPLLNFANVSFFTRFNSLGTLSALYLVAFVLTKGAMWGINLRALPPLHLAADAAALSGMLAMSFYIHNIIVTIMSNNARQEKNGRDLSIAFLLVTATYTAVGAVFYVCFPLPKACIEDNMLNNFETHDTLTAVARAVLLFQVVTVFPLVAFMLRREALSLLPWAVVGGAGAGRPRRGAVPAVNAAIVVMCVLVACFCPSIGNIIRYTGAASGLVHVFALPSLLHMRSLHLRGKLTPPTAVAHIAIIVFGAVNLLMQFFVQ
ncbi:sodium-coupled neutral amino acid transporter 9 homolog isoform X2 [Aricia agestis]|uniref:sodium-coupled neutral amino acid transporter 9 homolog isoform X2 n=1 Tax=Aricia agestis TaxID=91739 RepID=UPI001C2057A8|nr:sodium-coupled neutral amino acid transporter 9 homolog isoform X2 [Aricia agestis]